MRVEVLSFKGCPNFELAVARLRAVLAVEGWNGEIAEVEVNDEASAERLHFPGSPTIRIDGRDVEPGAQGRPAAFACRRYPGGAPSEEMIRAAVREAGKDA